ncbi:RagB/SusD family nutrient uptake outer membrane protein [Chitinophaga sp. RCC_12]|uniref:RagB/SusD family nutrient uptake outer membrane protein n=1 Tax=Chitinophaga sp. RCC_12 TaxID=3239226 RepID=UPI0035234C83
MNKQYIISSLFLLAIVATSSCKKLIEIPSPSDQLTRGNVFNDSATAVSAINGLYSYMYNYTSVADAAFKNQITLTGGMAADEFYYFSASTFDQYKNNAIPVTDATNLSMWTTMFGVIYQANSIIEGVVSGNVSDNLKNHLRGEALFVRAVSYFYLTNFYGDVPLVLTTEVSKNSMLARSEGSKVYEQIVVDLKEAKQLLPIDYNESGGERTRANSWAATAMLSRVYLYMGNYADAILESSAVINQNTFYTIPTPSQAFLASSREAILQFYTNVYNYTYIQNSLSPQTDATTAIPAYVIRDGLLSEFEQGDQRKNAWVASIIYNNKTYYYPQKYKRNSYSNAGSPEYDLFLRLGEQFLIRAESYTQLGKLTEAQDDLTLIRKRAGLGRPAASDKASLLLAIEKERRTELFAEYAHRWFDLKRTKRLDAVLKSEKPNTWKSFASLFPIPQSARSTNLNLSQNSGY